MPRSEGGGSGAYVSPESAKRMKKVTNDQPTIRQAGYGLQSLVRCTVDSKSSSIHQSMTPPTMRRRQPMPNHKLGLISPTIGLAIIAAHPTPESGTATTMIQKASKKVLLVRVQAAVSGYGQLYGHGSPRKLTPSTALTLDEARVQDAKCHQTKRRLRNKSMAPIDRTFRCHQSAKMTRPIAGACGPRIFLSPHRPEGRRISPRTDPTQQKNPARTNPNWASGLRSSAG